MDEGEVQTSPEESLVTRVFWPTTKLAPNNNFLPGPTKPGRLGGPTGLAQETLV